MKGKNTLIMVTRSSRLALWQAKWVKKQLQQHHPDLNIEIKPRSTIADNNPHIALQEIGGKGLFVKELQSALLDKKADIAVHSVKDLAAKDFPGLTLAAVTKRGDPRDVLVSQKFNTLAHLPNKAVLGTASPRRQSQLLALRPDLTIKLLRGNVTTRLEKLAAGAYDAIVLAAAGLQRLGLSQHIHEYFEPEQLLPAIGQGAIGIECRLEDLTTQKRLSPLNHAITQACVSAERAVNAQLGGNCFTPIAAHATHYDGVIELTARVGSLDGKASVFSKASAACVHAESLGTQVGNDLINKGATRFLQLPMRIT